MVKKREKMKKLIVSLIISVITFIAIAEDTPMFDHKKGAVLEQDLAEGKIYGSLKHMAKDKANKIRLIGNAYLHTPKDKILAGNTYALIGWLGVQKVDAVDKVVAFKEPLVSSFVFKNGTDIKNVSLPTFGELSYLAQAINDLEQDKVDYEDLKKPRKIKFPVGQNDKNAFWLVSNKGAKQVQAGKKIQDLNGVEPSANPISVNDLGNDKQNYSNERNQNSSNSNSSFGSNNSGAGHSLPGFQSETNNGINKDKPYKSKPSHKNKRKPRSNCGNPTITNPSGNDNGSPNNPNPSETHYRDAENMDLYVVPSIDENNPPTQGDAVVITNTPNGRRVYLVRNGRYVRNRNGELVSVPVDTNTDNLQTDSNGRVQRNSENNNQVNEVVNDILSELAQGPDSEGLDLGPEITVELTEEGCNPEHDVLQEKVFITARARRLENGTVVDEGQCERTLESYPVKRDYLCEECVDEVNNDNRVAYARYMEHWIDREEVRHDLGVKVDMGLPFQFFEDTKGCPFDTDSEQGFAIKTSRLGYLNKFGIFKTVEECRVVEDSDKYRTRETEAGCELVHDFDANVSHRQKRIAFTKNGREYEAKGCHVVEDLPHEFTTERCRARTDIVNGTAIPMALRGVRIDGIFKLITQECEPQAEVPIQSTYEGCINALNVQVPERIVYLHKRYFYELGNGENKFVTGCVLSNDNVPAVPEWSGEYYHFDNAHYSAKKTGLWVSHPFNNQKILVDFSSVRDDSEIVQHVQLEDGRWQRPDGTFYVD